jgi:hypothetical protein
MTERKSQILQKGETGKKTPPEILIQTIDKSKVPLAEELPRYTTLKTKVKNGSSLSPEELLFLEGLVSKARQWEKGVKSSLNTDPRDTLPG